MSLRASTIPEFSPPGNLNDLTPTNRSKWSKGISQLMNNEINRSSKPLTQFFNGTVTPYEVDQTGVHITWNGFPNKVIRKPALVGCLLVTLYSSLSNTRALMSNAGRLQMPVAMARTSTWSGLWSKTAKRISSAQHSLVKDQRSAPLLSSISKYRRPLTFSQVLEIPRRCSKRHPRL